MPEILYEIPVNDIFGRPCECPVCAMQKKLDDDEVAFAMGPSYMEDDIRLTTDKIGFCAHHMQMMYDFENRLGLGLILNTHMQNIIKNVETLQKKKRNGSKRLFAKDTGSALSDYIKQTTSSCTRKIPISVRNSKTAKDSVSNTMVCFMTLHLLT